MTEYNLLRVLIVDDDESFSSTLIKMLTHLRVGAIERAPTGDEALELVAVKQFDLILCDLRMPGRDGVETMRLLAERGVQSAILLLSGSDPRLLKSAEELGKARGLNVVGALSKPMRLTDIQLALSGARKRLSPRTGRQVELVPPEELERAIKHDQLQLHYQPQLNLDTCQFVGTEALVRWNHPERGMIFPDTFIPVAEQTGLIEPLTDWVVKAAIKQCSLWHSHGLNIGVSVNISAKSMRRLDLPDRLLEAVNKASLEPSALTLEVTETGVTDDLEALLDIATRLRLKGFPLSIDDFGTGFSSMAQLRRLPFTELKLDRSFVSGALRDVDAKSLLDSSVELAKRLQLKTVAEGIETRDEWDMLSEMGVDLGQGYYMARPMPAEKLDEWLSSWRSKVA